jgi:hypothetical protein
MVFVQALEPVSDAAQLRGNLKRPASLHSLRLSKLNVAAEIAKARAERAERVELTAG